MTFDFNIHEEKHGQNSGKRGTFRPTCTKHRSPEDKRLTNSTGCPFTGSMKLRRGKDRQAPEEQSHR